MKVVGWGNDASSQFQGLTHSKLLPQLTQDEFLLAGWCAETPRKCEGLREWTELLGLLFLLQRQFS
jgi:hypothetical protein